jgi:hypothetical protein
MLRPSSRLSPAGDLVGASGGDPAPHLRVGPWVVVRPPPRPTIRTERCCTGAPQESPIESDELASDSNTVSGPAVHGSDPACAIDEIGIPIPWVTPAELERQEAEQRARLEEQVRGDAELEELVSEEYVAAVAAQNAAARLADRAAWAAWYRVQLRRSSTSRPHVPQAHRGSTRAARPGRRVRRLAARSSRDGPSQPSAGDDGPLGRGPSRSLRGAR